MHGSVRGFLSGCKELYPDHFSSGSRVVEFGSRDINGSPREFFQSPDEYIGIDCNKGRGVDVVGICHEFEPDRMDFDVVVSTEMLEHDPYWEKSLQHAVQLLRSGGLFALSCGSEHRPTHHEQDSPTPGYYGGRSGPEVQKVLEEACDWDHLIVEYQRHDLDLMVRGVKS